MIAIARYGVALAIWRIGGARWAYRLESLFVKARLLWARFLGGDTEKSETLQLWSAAIASAADCLADGGADAIYAWGAAVGYLDGLPDKLRREAAVLLYPDKRDARACELALGLRGTIPIGRIVALRAALILRYAGRLGDAAAIIEPYAGSFPLDHIRKVLEAPVEIAMSGYHYAGGRRMKRYRPVQGRVAYVANYTRPHIINGYVIRTHNLTRALSAAGTDIIVFARYGFPGDYFLRPMLAPRMRRIDGVTYRTKSKWLSGYRVLPLNEYLDRYVEYLFKEFARDRPAVVHAASNYLNGLAASEAARLLGIRYVYEMRGLWELTAVSREPKKENTDEILAMERGECDAACLASHVFAIGRFVVEEMVRRGVPRERFSILPNGADCNGLAPVRRDDHLAGLLHVDERMVFGFVGSLVDYEGLDDMLEAIAVVETKRPREALLLLVGGGEAKERLMRHCVRLGVGSCVRFVGQVPHGDVKRYYSIIDVAVFPRRPVPVCRLVPPLKPLEAMAMGKACLFSNVEPLSEIYEASGAGYTFEAGNRGELARCLLAVVERGRVGAAEEGQRSRAWVCRERSWRAIAERAVGVYDGGTGG